MRILKSILMIFRLILFFIFMLIGMAVLGIWHLFRGIEPLEPFFKVLAGIVMGIMSILLPSSKKRESQETIYKH